jgi:hypothetical protein
MNFINWIWGKAEKSTYIKSISLAIGIYFSGIISGMVFFKPSLSILMNRISDIGNTQQNPIGSIFFNLGLILSGLLMIVHANYFYYLLSPHGKTLSLLSAACIVIEGLGNMMVGFFPENINISMHLVSALMSFGGTIVSSILSFIPLIKKVKNKAPWPKVSHLFLMYSILFVVILISISFVGIPMLIKMYAVTYDAKYIAVMWPLCEWLIAAGCVSWIFGMIVISPQSLKIKK